MDNFSGLSVTESLCSIGNLCQVCGVTRRMVLNYEDHGLIQPISVNPASGHRYYGAQSVARVRHIRALQQYGLSLDDIGRFLAGDQSVLRQHLDHLKALQAEIREQISRTEALLTPPGELTVFRTVLSGGHHIVATEDCKTSQERFLMLWRFTAYVLQKGWRVANLGGLFSILHTDPQDPKAGMTSAVWALDAPNEESVCLEEKEALCVNLKGPYTLLPKAIGALRQYAEAHGLPSTGNIRLIYLTSPQSHSSPEDYVTRVFLEL